MAYTSFGEYVRILRIKHHQVMGDMAKILGTTTPYLSSVENGRKNVPKEWIDKIEKHYGLNSADKAKLINAVDESKVQYKIVPKNAGAAQRKAAVQFARSFDEMDDETAEKIIALLNAKEDKA